MKKSLAPPKRENRMHLLANKKESTNEVRRKSISTDKNYSTNTSKNYPKQAKENIKNFGEHFKNKNLISLPTGLLVTLSGLTTLDISYNKLNDSQIELVINSCIKLTTLCIQGNVYSLIPATIWKLKELVNFRHDWLKVCYEHEDNYEPEERLKKIKSIVQKPETVVKINRIVGLDFENYCRNISHTSYDCILTEKITRSDCSSFSKESMMKHIREYENSKIKHREKSKPILEKEEPLSACTNMCGIDLPKEGHKMSISHKRESIAVSSKDLSEAETDCGSHKIKSISIIKLVENIKNISEDNINILTQQLLQKEPGYLSPGFPLHELFANFDSNIKTPSEIDGLLLKNYNPNLYDNKGLSPYHICIIQNQRKGLEYLLNISGNNPGFFDLEMISQKEGRNILHFSVFLKNYTFTKQLIDFGLPIDRRDLNGARIIHLVDQNYEFLVLLRKLIKKTVKNAKSANNLTVPGDYHKRYHKHPQRIKEETKYRNVYSENKSLLEMYELAMNPKISKSPSW